MKKILLVSAVLLLFLTISAVSADVNQTSDYYSNETENVDISPAPDSSENAEYGFYGGTYDVNITDLPIRDNYTNKKPTNESIKISTNSKEFALGCKDSVNIYLQLPEDSEGYLVLDYYLRTANTYTNLMHSSHAPIRNGSANCTFTAEECGEIMIKACFIGNYQVNEETFLITAIPKVTYPQEMIYGEEKYLTVQIHEVSNESIAISTPSDYGRFNLTNGFANVSLSNLPVGLNRITITFLTCVKVDPYYLTIDVKIPLQENKDLIMNYNDGSAYSLKVYENGKAASNKNVSIKINSKEYDVKTDSKGIAKLKIKEKVGKYIITASYGNHTVKNTLTVKKAPTTVKAPKVSGKYKKSKYFKITVKSYKKAVKGLKLKVKVYTGKKYKTYTIKTDKKGVAKLNTKRLKVGKHKVTISSGNANYKVSGKSTITIKK